MFLRRFGVGIVLLGLAAGGCSIQELVVSRLASALAEGGDVYASDEDPDLVADALPFALKTIETLLAQSPQNPDLLYAACTGFTQYAYAFVETEALELELSDYGEHRRLEERALKLYLRSLDYCLEGLELERPGISARLRRSPEEAAGEIRREQLDLAFWTGAAWGSAITLALDRPEIAADVGAPRALLERIEELDPAYGDGLIQAALLPLDALPPTLGGNAERAEQRYLRAQELGGEDPGLHVTMARTVAVKDQDRERFVELLQAALAFDLDRAPQNRLVNIIVQRRAEILLERVDEYFFADPEG